MAAAAETGQPTGNGHASGFQQRAARVREVFGRRPSVGVGPAAKSVVDDAKSLIQAEIALAKAEIAQGVKAKATGVTLLVVTAVCAWLALQALLIAAGFALALVVPGWAAALIVAGVLLLVGVITALVARGKLAAPAGVETTKRNVEEDLAWTKAHLPDRERLQRADPPRS